MQNISGEKILELVKLQHSLNQKITSENYHLEFDIDLFRTAIMRELGEMVDHIGWEWWKNPKVNIQQAQLELVDILHFYISFLIRENFLITIGNDPDYQNNDGFLLSIASELEIGFKKYLHYSQHDNLPNIFSSALEFSRGYTPKYFAYMCLSLNMNFDLLYWLYKGKNVLNKFRQDNGYKEGTYKKIWDGEEDNIYLYHYIKDCLDNDIEITEAGITEHLDDNYQLNNLPL